MAEKKTIIEKIIIGLIVLLSTAIIISSIFGHQKGEYVVMGIVLDYILVAAFGCIVNIGF